MVYVGREATFVISDEAIRFSTCNLYHSKQHYMSLTSYNFQWKIYLFDFAGAFVDSATLGLR